MVTRSATRQSAVFLSLAALMVAAVFAAGCQSSRVQRLNPESYPASSLPADIRLYIEAPQREHVEIAWIDSFASLSDDRQTKQRQLEQLRRRAASLGANALVEIAYLSERHRGMVIDTSVPFTAWEPGSAEPGFIRGKAIRFTGNSEQPAQTSISVGEEGVLDAIRTPAGASN